MAYKPELRTYRKHICSQSVQDTCVQTGFSFCHKPNPCLAFISITYQPTLHRRSSHLRLLSTFPSVGVTQNELHIMFDCGPEGVTVCVGIDNEVSGTTEEVGEKIAEDVYSRFSSGKWGEAHAIHFECHSFWA